MANILPRVSITPDVEQGIVNVELTKPTNINVGNPSAFPLANDKFKGLSYQTASQSDLKDRLALYYSIMNKIMAGTATPTDMTQLEVLSVEIREYVLTDDDYNLIIGALQNMQTYVLKFMYTDITNKGKAMDTELNKVIADLNRFMTELEAIYSKSPSDYPIPDKSVLMQKLSQEIQDTLDVVRDSSVIMVSDTKPANIGSGIMWFNTGVKL